jgi:hypothetical protein
LHKDCLEHRYILVLKFGLRHAFDGDNRGQVARDPIPVRSPAPL